MTAWNKKQIGPMSTKAIFCLPIILFFLCPPLVQASTPSFADFDKRAKAGEKLNVVFFGSSLTWGTNATDPQLTSYRGLISKRMRQEYPKAHFTFWDSGLGGTGSQLGAFRVDRDVLARKPDLVFLDFSANDDLTTATPETLAAFEALLRRIIQEGKAPVVTVILPFRYHVDGGKLEDLKRRDAHLTLARAYNTAVGDAVKLVHERLKSGKVKASVLWPFDRVHPDDPGYALFAEAVWDGFQAAVKKGLVCKAPDKMLHAGTYMKTNRFPLSRLANLPAGWHRSVANRTSVSFDMLMSRWLDDICVAANRITVVDGKGKKQSVSQKVDKLRIQFKGTTVLLFGESTLKSCKYRIYLDGTLMQRDGGNDKEKLKEYDAGWLASLLRGNSHLVHVVATGLDEKSVHTLEVEPVFSSKMVEQEMRLESICVAGGEAKILNKTTK